MSRKEAEDYIRKNSVLVERIKKEQRFEKVRTEFSVNVHKLHVLSDNPTSSKPPNLTAEDWDFVAAYRKACMEPTKKYPHPLTESQEIGWMSSPLIPPDPAYNFRRVTTDVTRYPNSVKRLNKNQVK